MNILLPVKQSIKKLSSDLGVQLLLLYLLLVIPVVTARLRQNLDRVFEMFRLKKRAGQKAGTLSGGEQQMLAVARALIPEPKLLLFDEPSLGLAPNLVKGLFDKFVELNKKLGITILIVEQKVREVLKISDRVYSLKLGSVSFSGKSEELLGDKETLKTLFL